MGAMLQVPGLEFYDPTVMIWATRFFVQNIQPLPIG